MEPRVGPVEVLPRPPPPPELVQARLLARLLDDAIPIPGTPWRIGIDPLIGLVPGLGDLLGAVLSGALLLLARRMGAPRTVIARMGLSVALETVVGIVPLAGDLFDAAWKSNARNLALLEAWHERPAETERASRTHVAIAAGLVLALAAAAVFGGWQLVAWAARAMGTG